MVSRLDMRGDSVATTMVDPPIEGLFRRLQEVSNDIEADLQAAEAKQQANSCDSSPAAPSAPTCGLAVCRPDQGGRSAWVWVEQHGRRPKVAELAESGFAGCKWLEGPPGARNLLLLLHGLGDTPAPFARLGKTMALPETSALALQAPLPLPAGLDGFMWHESFDDEGDLLPPEACSLEDARASLRALLATLERCGWPTRRVFMLGYMQGGQVALDLALHLGVRLGGVVSVCGHLAPEHLAPPLALSLQTPLLIVTGTRDDAMPLTAARRSFDALRAYAGRGAVVRLSEIEGRAIGSEHEMRPVMEFFAEHLELHTAALENDPSIIRVQ